MRLDPEGCHLFPAEAKAGRKATPVPRPGAHPSVGRKALCLRSRQGSRRHPLASGCNNIGFVTVSLATSESAPETAEADVLVIGVIQTPDGPAAAPGLAGVDEALGGTLADTLAALGATGELEELTKIPGGGKLPATLVLAVGLGSAPEEGTAVRRRRSSAGPPEPRCGRPPGRRRRARWRRRPGGQGCHPRAPRAHPGRGGSRHHRGAARGLQLPQVPLDAGRRPGGHRADRRTATPTRCDAAR